MKINVGSQNITKIESVKDAVKMYPGIFPDAEVFGVDVKIEQFGHPKNIQEVVEGAIERAKQAFDNADYSFGIESGLIGVPGSKSGFLETAACAIYDGRNIALGLSPAFEWPRKVTQLILNGMDGSQAFKKSGLTEHEKAGSLPGGIVGILTKGRMPREDQTRYAIIMAMVQLEHPELY